MTTHFVLSIWDVINYFIIAAGIGISGLSIIQIGKSPVDKQVKAYFTVFLSLVITYVSMYLVRMLMDGSPGDGARIILRIATLTEFMVSGFMAFMLIVMIQYSAMQKHEAKKAALTAQGILAAHVILLVIASFTDLYYYFDENNVYHRSKLYLLSNLFPVLMLIQGSFLLIRFRSKFEKRILSAYWIYIAASLAAITVQAFFSEIKFILLATTAAAVNMFAVITDYLTEKYEKQKIKASCIETELSTAKRIQEDKLPNIFPAFPERDEFDIYALMHPAKEVGGDFYDFFMTDDDRLAMVIADVSGKGIPAALFMMSSKILIDTYSFMGGTPAEILEMVNKQICANNQARMFVTVWLGILEISTGKLITSSAGHEYPMLNLNGKYEILKDKHGPPVGVFKKAKYTNYELTLKKGDSVFVYTDGVTEAADADHQLFGTERILDSLNVAYKNAQTEQDILKEIRAAVDRFVKDTPQIDDITMLGLKYFGTEKTKI